MALYKFRIIIIIIIIIIVIVINAVPMPFRSPVPAEPLVIGLSLVNPLWEHYYSVAVSALSARGCACIEEGRATGRPKMADRRPCHV